MRATTIHGGSAVATAKYYTQYLTQAPGEQPGQWMGTQAAALGLTGEVSTVALERMLSGCDPTTGAVLGFALQDRTLANGKTIRAVAAFDSTLSAPKSLSAWWALTGDDGLAECHDIAAWAVVRYMERFGATTRVRSNGRRLYLDTQGLMVAAFRQTTSRLDDPQLHTHLVIAAKVQTVDGRWLALDARVLKQHQRALGGLYQSVLRAELTRRYGVAFAEIVSGQAEIAGVPSELIDRFSKRAAQVREALEVKLSEFTGREGRDPSKLERAAMEREAAADSRRHKTGNAVTDLRSRWLAEAATVGVTPDELTTRIVEAARTPLQAPPVSVADIMTDLTERRSAWHRMDVLRALTDRLRPEPGVSGEDWATMLDQAVERVLDVCVDLDPGEDGPRRGSDGRSVWIEPVAAHVTSRQVIEQEEAIVAWVLDAGIEEPRPSITVERNGLDVLQGDAAEAVAGTDRLVVIVGPAGAGKTTMLAAAVTDLNAHGRRVFGIAPTAKAARVLGAETGMETDTVAKLLHEWARPDGPQPAWRLPAGTTLIVDEAGMLATRDLHQLTQLATRERWRLAMVGDPHQLQAVGRGGMFAEICTTARTIELEHVHRFINEWEATASLQLRHGDPAALDAYLSHDRIVPGSIDEHLDRIANAWQQRHQAGESLAITTTLNEHVDKINRHIQHTRIRTGVLDPAVAVAIADGDIAMIGDVIATRRNQRQLHTSTGDIVRNRERWTITNIADTGEVTVTRLDGHGHVTLPTEYARDHVRLGYAASEPGNQSATHTAGITLATPATTGRGLYVAVTRGRRENMILVVTDTHDLNEARDILDTIIASDRADTSAIVQRRQLAQQQRPEPAPPAPAPKRRMPAWFHDLHDQTVTELQHARAEHDQATATRQRLEATVDNAVASLANADRDSAPHVARIDTADAAAREAQRARQVAEQHLDQTGLRGRRHAKTDLAVAARVETGAKAELDRARVDAGPALAARGARRAELAEARAALRTHDTIERWHYRPERIKTLQRQLDDLDLFHDSINGHPVDQRKLAAALDRLGIQRNNDHPAPTSPLAPTPSSLRHRDWLRTQPPPMPARPDPELGR